MEDNSVLLEDSNIEECVAPRKSMSQPSLAVQDIRPESTETTPKHGMNNAYSASNVRSIPIIQTWHENDQLKGQMYSLRCEVQMYERKYLEAKEACHKSVQEVLDEYVNLKVAQDDMEEKSRLFAMMQKDLYDAQEKLDSSKNLFERQSVEFEQQRRAMEQKIHELESALADTNNTTIGSFRGTLDDILKKGDPNYTLTNDDDRKIQDLESKVASEQEKVACLEELVENLRQEIDDQSARLAGSENARAQLEAAAGQGILGAAGAAVPNATFVIGNARESQTEAQIKYIDELEKQLNEAKNECERARLALVEYMNKCSKLENDIHTMRKNTTFDSSSILVAGKTSEELKAQIDKVNSELNTLRAENRELRIRCDQLTGGEGSRNVSVSLGASRLMAGISATNLDSSVPNETGGTSMRILPRESQLDDLQESQILQSSQLPLMDTTAAKKNREEFDALWAEFESEQHRMKDIPNDTVESSFNSSMPPPDRDATQSFLSQKGFKNSPITSQKAQSLQHQLQTRQISMSAEPIQNNSFSFKATSALIASPHTPILQDVQQILDSSAILLEGQHDAAVNVEKMQAKMTQIRNALTRLFERLKSSAALFEEILEKMGSSSPLADRIKQMKLAFETSMCDHADVSNFLDAAEKDLTNMSLNFSVLEKSIVGQSFVADISRRFTIAPGAEDVASSSLLNASYSPIFKFSAVKQSTEVDQLKKELADLKTELEKARARELRSPLQTSPNRLSDVQIKAAQNFEELEVCQATLKKVEGEKAALAQEIADLDASNHVLLSNVSELKQDLDKALERLNVERQERQRMENTLSETNEMLNVLKKETNEQSNKIMVEMEKRIVETQEQVEAEHQALIESLKRELNISLSEENKIRDYMEQMKVDMERLRRRTTEAEVKVESAANERQQLIEQIVDLENKLEKLSDFEKETTDCAAKVASKKKELELARQREDVEKEALEGLEKIQKEMSELTKKNMKTIIIKENAMSIRMVCEELCCRISQEKARQHEYAQTMSMVNDKIEQLTLDAAAKKSASPVEKENVPPVSSAASSKQVGSISQKSSSPKFICPTRQLLHESTMAVDAIVQKLKKTQFMAGMGPELKETVANLISDSRTLRDFLHQKLNLFKGIDMSNWKNETVDQLLERMERCYQDIAILEEENRKFKKEIKRMKATIPNLGADVQERIKREIGGIAHDMKALKDLRRK